MRKYLAKFYKKLINILFILSMLSCSSVVIVGDKATYKDEYMFIDKVVNKFYKDARKYMVFKRRVPIPITVQSGGKKENRTLGTCYDFGFMNTITLNSDNWFFLSKISKFFVIYHELGHCFLGKNHTRVDKEKNDIEVFKDGCGKSIMSPTIQSNWCLKRHRHYYVRELFLGKE